MVAKSIFRPVTGVNIIFSWNEFFYKNHLLCILRNTFNEQFFLCSVEAIHMSIENVSFSIRYMVAKSIFRPVAGVGTKIALAK